MPPTGEVKRDEYRRYIRCRPRRGRTRWAELFNTFKIGRKGVDNGVLMLIAKGDRRVEIETGYGMEERLPDARVGTIIRSAMLPRFKQGDFDGGTFAGVAEVIGT